MTRFSRSNKGYQKLREELDSDTSDSCTVTALKKIETQKSEASHDDAITFWRNAVQPSFRSRRSGVDEEQLKKDFGDLEMLIYEKVLREYNLIWHETLLLAENAEDIQDV